MNESDVTLTTADGETIEARWDRPTDQALGTVVLCHPHPLQGGTMRAPLMSQVTTGLVERGFAVLRFNFRGVGLSSGVHDFGTAELHDVSAAWEAATGNGPHPTYLSGWSFGAATSLVWMAETGTAVTWAGIAPPIRSERTPALPTTLPDAPRTFILGDRDQFATVADTETYVALVGGDLQILKGSDHFFYFRESAVTDLIARSFGWTG